MIIPVVGLGAGGHAKVVLEILRMNSCFELVGLLDSKSELKGKSVLGVPVLGDDNCLSDLLRRGIKHFFIGVGSIGDVSLRLRLYNLALAHDMQPVSAIHPQAVVSSSATIGPGVAVMATAVINASAALGANVIINTGAIVEHDCVLADHVHVAPGARLASKVHIDEGAHIGLGAVVRQCIRIGRNAIVGAGAVVVKDIPDNVIVAGVPARILRRMDKDG
jgi:UDP-perosamine 4-acetyltransferase